MIYDDHHGSPYDRGRADCWYGRPFNPHFFMGTTYQPKLVETKDMNSDEIEAYQAGYDSEIFGGKWGE